MKVSEIFENAKITPSEKDPRWQVYAQDDKKDYTCYHIPVSKAKPNELRFKHELEGKVIISDTKYYPDEFKAKMNEAIDNGPGLIKAPKLSYDAKRSSQISPITKAELASRRDAVRKDKEYQRELDKMEKKAREARLNIQPKKKKIDTTSVRLVANKIEEVIGNTWPDGDPIDWLAPWVVKTFGVNDWQIMTILDKGARAIGKRYKGYYDYLAKTWDDFAEDNMELLIQSGQTSNPWK